MVAVHDVADSRLVILDEKSTAATFCEHLAERKKFMHVIRQAEVAARTGILLKHREGRG